MGYQGLLISFTLIIGLQEFCRELSLYDATLSLAMNQRNVLVMSLSHSEKVSIWHLDQFDILIYEIIII
jgi:hypothetical protein